MSLFNVYGIGHALVDMELQVPDTYLTDAKLQKGSMALVDETCQQELLEMLDGYDRHRSCGGSSANTLIAVAQFGGKAFHACKVANDETGHFFAQDMRANGVENSLDKQSHSGTTGRCLVFITPDAERTMCTHLGISETFSEEQISEKDLTQSDYLYVEGYLVSSPTAQKAALKAVQLARKSGVKTALTFSDTSMITYFREGLDAIIGDGLDLLFCNESEALAYTGCSDLNQAKDQLTKLAKMIGLTLGSKGATIYDGSQWIDIPGISVDAVDTNGAGDLFAGAFLYGITQGYTLSKAGQLACRSSSVLVTQFGARLKTGQALTLLNSQE